MVFVNRAEFGFLSGLARVEEAFLDNSAAQASARLLKYSFSRASYSSTVKEFGDQLPSFLLEIAVIHTQKLLEMSPLKLFIDTLQLLIESPVEKIIANAVLAWLGDCTGDNDVDSTRRMFQGWKPNKTVADVLKRHAAELLRVFCIGRFFY